MKAIHYLLALVMIISIKDKKVEAGKNPLKTVEKQEARVKVA